ncbi:DUF814-containing protein [Aureococcus anophagefferens]|nr:DUF814-containing protein [Aureococcus anophagefferens]
MVFYFTADAKDPKDGEDYVVYMGADKFENEGLIEWGQKRDVWFHVDGLSSAHVYLRLPLKNAQCDPDDHRCAGLLDRIPEGVVEDMCQLVKANSIEGCKKGSVMVVYTPWANLHKDETKMQTGAVGFHDNRHRVLRRVDKDKQAVKRIEKTRREAFPDLQQERLAYEREVVAWRKGRDKESRAELLAGERAAKDALEETRRQRDAFLAGMGGGPPAKEDVVVDDVLERTRRDVLFPEKAAAARRRDVGDACSGVDAALGQLGLAPKAGAAPAAPAAAAPEEEDEERPTWRVEADRRYGIPEKEARWLAARGYACETPPKDRDAAVAALAAAQRADASVPADSGDAEGAADERAERDAPRPSTLTASCGADRRGRATRAADSAATRAAKRREDAAKAKRKALIGAAPPPPGAARPPPPGDETKLAAAQRKAQDAQSRLGAIAGAAPRPGGGAKKGPPKAAVDDDDDYMYGAGSDSDSGDDFGVVKMEL